MAEVAHSERAAVVRPVWDERRVRQDLVERGICT